MRHFTPLLGVLCLGLSIAAGASAEIYRWTDDKGTVHATSDPGQIPEKYRDQLRKGGLTPRGKLSKIEGGSGNAPTPVPSRADRLEELRRMNSEASPAPAAPDPKPAKASAPKQSDAAPKDPETEP
jgi:hypothetical protein